MLLGCMVAGLFAGLLLAHTGGLPPLWCVYIGGTLCTLWLHVARSRTQLALGAALATAAWSTLLAPSPLASPSEEPAASGLGRWTLRVGRTACGDGCWAEATVVRCESIEGQACVPPGAWVSVVSDAELPASAQVTLLGRATTRPSYHNPLPSFAWPDSRHRVRVRAVEASSFRVDHIDPLSQAIAWVRGRIRRVFSESLSEPHAGIARALLLGEGSAVPEAINDAIRNAGVSHVLAVSGMHVTVLAGALVTLVRILWLRSPLALHFEARRAAAALGVLLAPLVARLCGASPSAWRAAFTSTLMFGLTALGLPPHALSVSALAVLFHAALDPREALHPGFVLSVLATAALLTGGRGGAGLWQVARESARAWLATAPFLALCFGSGSLVALVANVVLLPLGTLLIPAVVAHLGAGALGWGDVLGTRFVFETTSGAFIAASRFCSSLDPGLALPPLTGMQSLSAAALACVWLTRVRLRVRVGLSALCLCAAGASEWSVRHPLAQGELRVTFLDVGQGDAALIETAGQVALVDAGGVVQGAGDPGAEAVLPLLRALRIARLDLVVLSHPHPDHFGGLFAVMDTVAVGELWDTGQADAEHQEGGAVSQLLEEARRRGTRVRRPSELCGAPHPFGDATLEVLSPCPGFDEARSANDNSFVLKLRHGARSVLLTGDAEREVEAELLAKRRAALASDVLKVGHHGSRTSSTEAFVRAVSPWLSVISAGRGNRFAHPHDEVVERLSQHATHLLRTDQVGGIRVVSDGEHLRVDAWHPDVALAR